MRGKVIQRLWVLLSVALSAVVSSAQNITLPHDSRYNSTTYHGRVVSPLGDYDLEEYLRWAPGLMNNIVERESYDKELYEFGTSYQLARDYLLSAIQNGRDVSAYMTKTANSAGACPLRGDESVDVEKLLQATLLANVAERKWQEVVADEERYKEITKRLKVRCTELTSFDIYKADDLKLTFAPLPEYQSMNLRTVFNPLGLFDGPSVFSSRAKFEEKQRPIVEKMNNASITDAKYREQARLACEKIAKDKKDLLPKLEDLHSAFAPYFALPLDKALARRREILASCRKRYEDEVIAYFSAKARADAATAHAPDADEALRVGLVIQSNQRIHLAATRLKQISCAQGSAIASSIRTEIALSHVFRLSNTATVIPVAQKAVKEFYERCEIGVSNWLARKESAREEAEIPKTESKFALEQLVLTFVMLHDHPIDGEAPLTDYEIRMARIEALYPGCIRSTRADGIENHAEDCYPQPPGLARRDLPNTGKAGGKAPSVPPFPPGNSSSGGKTGDTPNRSVPVPATNDPNGQGNNYRNTVDNPPFDPTKNPAPLDPKGGRGSGPSDGHLGGTPFVGNNVPNSIPGISDRATIGGEGDQGDDVPHLRHFIYLRGRLSAAGPDADWAKKFGPHIDRLPPTYDIVEVKNETEDEAKVAEAFSKSLKTADPKIAKADSPDVVKAAIPTSITDVVNCIGKSSASAVDRWNSFDSLERLNSHGLELLPGSAALAVRIAVQEQRNPYGLLNESALGPTYGKISQDLGKNLATSENSQMGGKIRRQLNRAMIILTSSQTSENARAEVRGAAGLLIAADAAAARGRLYDAALLGRIASASLDSAMGIGSPKALAEGAELVHGMATGSDYAGRPMDAAEYAFGGIGKASSAFANSDEKARPTGFTIAGKPVGKFFRLGRDYVKNNSLRSTYLGALGSRHQADNAGRVTSGIGAVVSTGRKISAAQLGTFVMFVAKPIFATVLEEAVVALGIPGAGIAVDVVMSIHTAMSLANQISEAWTKSLETPSNTKEPYKTVDDYYKETVPGKKTRGSGSDLRGKTGGEKEANEDFDRLVRPESVEKINYPGGRRGKSYDGYEVNIRPTSDTDRSGPPTIQIETPQGPKAHIKVRYVK